MKDFTQTFFVAIIGVIVSLISFLVPLTYRFLRSTAQELGKWKGKNLYYDLKQGGFFIQQIRHYYIFADAITDIIAVSGAISVLSIIIVMSRILIPQIDSCHNIPFDNILSGNYNTLILILLLSFLYLIVWNIAWWNFERYLKEDNLSVGSFINLIMEKKWLWMIVKQIILAIYIIIFCVVYRYLSEFILLIVVIGEGMFLLIMSFTEKATEPKKNNTNCIRQMFYRSSRWLFFFGLLLIANCACFHTIFVIFSDSSYLGYGIIVMNIIILICFFLYWFLLGIIFTPNTALISIYARIRDI